MSVGYHETYYGKQFRASTLNLFSRNANFSLMQRKKKLHCHYICVEFIFLCEDFTHVTTNPEVI